MSIEDINHTFDQWNLSLSERQKKYINYQTMKNFAFHFDKVPSGATHDKFISLFSQYIEEVINSDFDFNADTGNALASKYLYPMADYYKDFLNFKPMIMLSNIIIWGIMGDTLLYISGIASHFYYIPVIISGLLLYYLYLLVFKVRKKMVYGLFY